MIDRVLLFNMRREMNTWFTEVLANALAPGLLPGQAMPPILDSSDLASYDVLGWLAFENLVVVQDRWVASRFSSAAAPPC